MAESTTLQAKYATTGKPYAGGIEGLSAGPVWVGPIDSNELPKSATAALPSGYKCLGYLSQDGVQNAPSISAAEIRAYGGDLLLNPIESYTETYTFTAIEINDTVLSTVWGKTSGEREKGTTVDHGPSGFRQIRPFVIINVFEDKSVSMKVIPRGQITSISEVSYTDTAPVGFNITISCLSGAYDDNPECTCREYISAPGVIKDVVDISAVNTDQKAVAPAK